MWARNEKREEERRLSNVNICHSHHTTPPSTLNSITGDNFIFCCVYVCSTLDIMCKRHLGQLWKWTMRSQHRMIIDAFDGRWSHIGPFHQTIPVTLNCIIFSCLLAIVRAMASNPYISGKIFIYILRKRRGRLVGAYYTSLCFNHTHTNIEA